MDTEKNLRLCLCFFASKRYWTDLDALEKAVEEMKADLADISSDVRLVFDEEEAVDMPAGDIMVAIPMSGAVQQNVIKAAEKFDLVCIYPGYIQGNFSESTTTQMLLLNAAPAVMDVYSVLRRRHNHAFLCLNKNKLTKTLKAAKGYFTLQNSKLLLIGDVEPWVISADRDLKIYQNRLGIQFEQVPLEVMEAYYHKVTEQEAAELYRSWTEGAADIAEPTQADVVNASRFCIALRRLIEDRDANGAAIACFRLLQQLGTTACLAVSHINNDTGYIAACEGDTDSAATMLMMKSLQAGKLWMANPNLQQDGTVNFVHCTAPTQVCGESCSYILRNHHESGIGVSTQVNFPDGLTLTACRLSDGASKITIQNATGRKGVYEKSCRTQYTVTFEDFDKYINTVLGCHQVFAFEDLSDEMRILSELLGMEIL